MLLPSVWREAAPYKHRKKINSMKEKLAENQLSKHQIAIYSDQIRIIV